MVDVSDLQEEILLLKQELKQHKHFKELYYQTLDYLKIAEEKLSVKEYPHGLYAKIELFYPMLSTSQQFDFRRKLCDVIIDRYQKKCDYSIAFENCMQNVSLYLSGFLSLNKLILRRSAKQEKEIEYSKHMKAKVYELVKKYI